MPSWVATTLAVIAGGVLTMLSAWLADRRLSNRDRERRREERHERLVTRRNDFQRETLLALQVASQKLLRSTGSALYYDTIANRGREEWKRQLLPEGLSDEILKQNTETMLLSSRIRDADIRSLADGLRSDAARVLVARDESEAESIMMTAGSTQQALIQRIGQILRDLDDAD